VASATPVAKSRDAHPEVLSLGCKGFVKSFTLSVMNATRTAAAFDFSSRAFLEDAWRKGASRDSQTKSGPGKSNAHHKIAVRRKRNQADVTRGERNLEDGLIGALVEIENWASGIVHYSSCLLSKKAYAYDPMIEAPTS
jgi:hypothetical protein